MVGKKRSMRNNPLVGKKEMGGEWDRKGELGCCCTNLILVPCRI
jgi:hypothetical protein